jgi:hypothetical protein
VPNGVVWQSQNDKTGDITACPVLDSSACAATHNAG